MYTPAPYIGSGDVATLERYLQGELVRIAEMLSGGDFIRLNLEIQFRPPEKVREGLIMAADGAHWNPGAGKGVYVYYSSAWHILG